MKKILIYFFLLLTTLGISISVLAQADIQPDEVNVDRLIDRSETTTVETKVISGERIDDFKSFITINKDGTIDVKEEISYNFDTLQRHGIYRTIPYIKTNQDDKKYKMKFESFSVVDESGQKYSFTITDESGIVKLKIGDANKYVTGLNQYIISYKVKGALTYFSEHDELYWNATGNEWEVPIVNSSSEITVPDNFFNALLSTECFVGYKGSDERHCLVDSLNNKIIIKTDRQLNISEGMTFALSFPKNLVAVLEPEEVVDFFDTLIGKLVILGLMLLITFWYLIYPFWIPIKWFLQGRGPKPLVGEARSWFDPPKTKSGRFMSPAETGTLIDERAELKDISGAIISLAQRGYFKIVEKKKGDYYFVRNETPVIKKDHNKHDVLLDYETKLIDGIFSKKEEVRLKNARLYKTVEDVNDMLYTGLVSEGCFSKNPNTVRTFYAGVAGLALFTFNIPLFVIALVFGQHMPKKTLYGAGLHAVAKSLKNFLVSQERQLEFQVKNQMMFEKLLPYAVVFGVEKIWANRFKDIDMTSPDWYQGYQTTNFNSVLLANAMSNSMSTFRSAASPPTSTRSTSGFSSGFSGGSSGGGGGGGGGGSW